MEPILRMHCRPSEAPRVAVPVGARSTGSHHVPKGWSGPAPRAKNSVQVFWGVAGRGHVRVEGRALPVGPGDVVVVYPGERFQHQAPDEEWHCRWWTMDGPLCVETVRAYGLGPPWPRAAGVCPDDLLDMLELQIAEVGLACEYAAAATVHDLLSHLAARFADVHEKPSSLVDRAVELLHEEYADPDLTVTRVAERLGTHRSRLSREFRGRTGLPPQRYLAALRLQRGITMLHHTALNVNEIARAVGYDNPAYFTRCVTRAMGQSPKELRRSQAAP